MHNADLPELDRCLAGQREVAERVGQPVLMWVTLFERALRTLVTGSMDEGEELADRAAATGAEADQADALTIYLGQLILIRYEQGRLDELVDMIDGAAEDNPGLPAFAAVLALACCELDRGEEARALLERYGRRGFADMPRDHLTISSLAFFAEAAAQLREQDAAAALYEQLEPWSGRLAFPGACIWGAVDLYLARTAVVLGRYEDSERHFTDAAALHERLGASSWLARTRCGWAEMLIERNGPGDAERARELCAQALVTAQELSLVGLEHARRSCSRRACRAGADVASIETVSDLDQRPRGLDGARVARRAGGRRRASPRALLAASRGDLRKRRARGKEHRRRLGGGLRECLFGGVDCAVAMQQRVRAPQPPRAPSSC